MLLVLMALYAVPVYLIFFKYKWVKLSAKWWCVIMAPPVAAGLFLWFGVGRYTPLTQDAYIQAQVVQVSPQVNGEVTDVLVSENQEVAPGTPLFRINSKPYQYQVDQLMAQLVTTQEQMAGSVAMMAVTEQAMRGAEFQVTSTQRSFEATRAASLASADMVRNVKAQLDFAQKELERTTKLLTSNSISQSEYDNSKKNVDSLSAQLAGALQQEQQSQATVSMAESQIASAVAAAWQARLKYIQTQVSIYPLLTLEAGITKGKQALSSAVVEPATENPLLAELPLVAVRDRKGEIQFLEGLKSRLADHSNFLGLELPGERVAKELLNQAQFNLEQTTVKSPVDGIVTNLHLSLGTYVRSGTPVIGLVDKSNWCLVANYPENWLGLIRPGDRVLYSLRNYPGNVRKATVASVGRGVIAGQGLPNAMLPDTQSRITRQTDTPQTDQRFRVIVSIKDEETGQPLRVGATGRAIVFASGGFPVLNTLITIILYVSSYLDYFFPQPSGLVILLIAAGVYGGIVWRRSKKLASI